MGKKTKKVEKRPAQSFRLPTDLMKRVKERAEVETEEKGYIVTMTALVTRALNAELAKSVRRG